MILTIKMGYNIKIKLVIEVGKMVKTFQTLLILPFLIWNARCPGMANYLLNCFISFLVNPGRIAL